MTPTAYELVLEVDPKLSTFRGTAAITVKIDKPVRSIFLHGKDLTVDSSSIDLEGGAKVAATVATIPERSLLRVDAASEIPAGVVTLRFSYKAPFAEGLVGLYRVQTDGHWYAFTQFEALDARRAFPCFDEPSFKTPFDVTLVTPKDDVAVSNGKSFADEVTGSARRVKFAKTEKLPTYLVAFAVGPLDIVEAPPIAPNAVRKNPVPLRGVAVRGKGKLLDEGLREHARVVANLEEYFGIPYPYDKLDAIAVPDFAAGAMENAGAIMYRESLLLVDPTTASEDQRRDVAGTVSHEVAHQWFGNLVTMAWWDDLWLNEAFATWMGQRVIGALHPKWNPDLELMGWVQGAMETDSLVSARKIRQPIVVDDDVENAFDDLTYSKGAGLIAMFERFLGPDKFKAGVRRYLDKHRFGTATTDQFFDAVFEGERAELPVSLRQFLERSGVPRVQLETKCEGKDLASLDVRIERYLPLGSSADPKGSFTLPLCVNAGGTSHCDVVSTEPGKVASIKPKAKTACPAYAFPNADGVGYVRFTPTVAQAKELVGRMGSLSTRERFALVDALGAAFRAGVLDGGALLELLEKTSQDPTREIAFASESMFSFVSEHVVAPEARAAFGAYVGRVFGARHKKLGWSGSPKDDADTRLSRKDSARAMLFFARDTAARKEALARARRLLELDKGDPKSPTPPDLLQAVMVVAAQDGGAEVFDAMVKKLKSSDDVALRSALLAALARADDEDLATRARAMVTDGSLLAGERLRFVFNLFASETVRGSTWAWFTKDLAKIVAAIPEQARAYLPFVVESVCDAKQEAPARSAFASQLESMPGAPRALENGIEKMKICSAVRERQAASVTGFLTKK